MRVDGASTELGDRMRAAARRRKLKATTIAAAMGLNPATIYRWWHGERYPGAIRLAEYARLVGCELEELEIVPPAVLDHLVVWSNSLMAGESQSVRRMDATETEQGQLNEAQMRQELAFRAGAAWATLSVDRQQQILLAILRHAREQVGDPDAA